MRVTIGDRSFNLNSDRGTASFEQELKRTSEYIKEQILEQIADRLVQVSPGLLRDLERRIQAQTVREAARIFEVARKIIESRRGDIGHRGGGTVSDVIGIRTSMLTNSIESFDLPKGLKAGFQDEVPWRRLSKKWRDYKAKKYPRNANKFFSATGNLKTQFKRNQKVWVNSKFGGVMLDSKTARKSRGKFTDVRTDIAMGDVNIRIFPKISSLLLPGLASRRWADVDRDGRFDKAVIGGKTGEKLAGPIPGQQRPLLQPIVQFFILYRVPIAIRRAVEDWVKANTSDIL
jgi:hypothetical protein